MDTPGFLTPNPVGSYNVLVDDVAFYKRSALPSGMSDLPALPSSGGAHPLHGERRPSTAAAPSRPASNGRLLALAYDNWKKRFVVADSGGFKVIRPENGNDTVSEGIAYGMMIAVYFDDKALFDGLYKYWTVHVRHRTVSMTWCIPAGGGSCSASGGTATDADEDAAFAMLMASKQWPSGGYGGTATTLINAVMSTDMSGTYIKAGSNYTASTDHEPVVLRAGVVPGLRVALERLSRDNSYTLLERRASGPQQRSRRRRGAPGGSCNAPAIERRYERHDLPVRLAPDPVAHRPRLLLERHGGREDLPRQDQRVLLGQGLERRRARLRHLQPERHRDAATPRSTPGRPSARPPSGAMANTIVLDVHERRVPAGARPPQPGHDRRSAGDLDERRRAGTRTSTPPSAC